MAQTFGLLTSISVPSRPSSLWGLEASQAENQLFGRLVAPLTHRGVIVTPLPHTHTTTHISSSKSFPLLIIYLAKKQKAHSPFIHLPPTNKHTNTNKSSDMCVRSCVHFCESPHRLLKGRRVMGCGPCDYHLDWFSLFGCSSEENNCCCLRLSHHTVLLDRRPGDQSSKRTAFIPIHYTTVTPHSTPRLTPLLTPFIFGKITFCALHEKETNFKPDAKNNCHSLL